MVIKNLDTGEEFVIGENDPDFEFDTFELCQPRRREANATKDTGQLVPGADESIATTGDETLKRAAPVKSEYQSWIDRLYAYFFYKKSDNQDAGGPGNTAASCGSPFYSDPFVTQFTKLSSFKFRKELGKGAFGRVLLAEAKTNGNLYAMKIISKSKMRSSDKKQAKAERDILHAMSNRHPHPFVAGKMLANLLQ
jgi:hypothetical protein